MTTTATTKPKRVRRFAREPLGDSSASQLVQADPSEADLPAAKAPPRAESKTGRVLAFLQRPDGATLDELVAATGWLPHTTRAALTGLRKKGHAVQRTVIDGQGRYTISSAA